MKTIPKIITSILVIAGLSSCIQDTTDKLSSSQYDDDYLTFLRANIARFIEYSTDRVVCPKNLALTHGLLLNDCSDDENNNENM